MGINEITSSGMMPAGPAKKTNLTSDTRKPSPKEDKVELSEEARSLLQSEHSKKIEEIQQRMDSGFYDRQDVKEKIADAVLKDLANGQ